MANFLFNMLGDIASGKLSHGLGLNTEKAQRYKANRDISGLIDLVNKQEQQAKNVQTSNDLYKATQEFQRLTGLSPTNSQSQLVSALNPEFKSNIDVPQGQDYTDMSGLLSGSYKEPQPSQESLIPTGVKQGPSWDSASMYGTIQQAIQKGVDPSRALPFIQNYYSGKQAKQKEDLKKERIDSLTNMLNSAKSLQQATSISVALERYGVKVDAGLLKEVFKNPEYSIQTVDYGDRKKVLAVNKNDPNDVVDLESGNVGMTPYQQESLATARRGQDLTYAAAKNRAANSSNSNTATLLSLYKDATETVQEPTGEFDAYGRPIMTRRVKNPELAQRLQPYVNSVIPQVGGQQSDIAQRISAAVAAGYSDQEIAEKLGVSVSQIQQIQANRQSTTASRLGIPTSQLQLRPDIANQPEFGRVSLR